MHESNQRPKNVKWMQKKVKQQPPVIYSIFTQALEYTLTANTWHNKNKTEKGIIGD